MRQFPLVSIITPSFNQGPFIEETILSVLNQDYPHIEYIVMDGGSTDQTLDILKKYSDRLTYTSGTDDGQSDAINKGWEKATGEIVAWLNSDDTYTPGAIKKVVEAFRQYPDSGIIYGDCYWIDTEGHRIRWMHIPQVDLESLLCFTILQQPAVFLQKKVLDQVGLLNTDLHFSMDHEYWIRAAFRFPFQHIPYFLASAREHEAAKSSANHTQFPKDAMVILDKFFSDPEMSEQIKGFRKKAYGGAYLNSAYWFCLAGEFKEARRSIIQSIKLKPSLLRNEMAIPVILESFLGISAIRPLRWVKHEWIRLEKHVLSLIKTIFG